MQAARLVDYSDSEDDEEMEWREYHKQRSMLRIPRRTKAPQPPTVVTEEPSPSTKNERPASASSDRDFAFTPRKRASFLRSTTNSSPLTQKPTYSPQVDFAFSSSSTASPMSDEETKHSGNSWTSSSVQQQPFEAAIMQPEPPNPMNQKPSTFGAFDSTEGAQSASPFRFGAQKNTASARENKSPAFKVDTYETTPTSTDASQSSPFTFGSFKNSTEQLFGDSAPTASFLRDHKLRSSGSHRGDTRTPQRQKDLHRAAKRRVGRGAVKRGSSSFGGSPASTISTPSSVFSPFIFNSPQANGGKAPIRNVHSPMDVEMDGNVSSDKFSAFSFDSPKSATAQTFTFGTTPSAGSEKSNPVRFDSKASNRFGKPSSSNTPASRSGHGAAVNGDMHDTSEKTRVFDFGSGSTAAIFKNAASLGNINSSSFTFGTSHSGAYSENSKFASDSKRTSFEFGSQAAAGDSHTRSSQPRNTATETHARSASFSFDTAFKEYEVNKNPWMSTNDKRGNSRDSSTHADSSSFFNMGKENATGRESLEVRMARRKQVREAKAAQERGSARAPTRAGGAQKVLFRESSWGDENRSDNTEQASTSDAATSQNGMAGERMKTNAFQRGAAPSGTFSRYSGSANTWSFKAASSFTFREPTKGGVFMFGAREPDLSPSPPVENLKSNFDGFNIGSASKSGRGQSSKGRLGKPHQGHRNHTSFTNKPKGDSDQSAFGQNQNGTTGFVPHNNGFTAFTGPFATPAFGQQKNSHQDGSQSMPDHDSSTPSPFSPDHPSHSHSVPVFGKSNSFGTSAEPSETSRPNKSKSAGDESPFNMGIPRSAFLPGRRILRACRPSQRQSQTKTPGSPGSDGTEARSWSEWKSLGGSAYTKRAYQEAADCYLNSIIVLENLLADQPELKTDQIMKDKAKLHSNRAAALMMLLQLADAQRECHLSIESDPAYTKAYMRLGRIQVMVGDVEGAKENSITAKQLLSMSETHRPNDVADAAGLQKIEDGVEKLEKLRVEIMWCLDVHDYSGALAHLREALAVAPHCRSLQTQKARALFEQKNYAEVIDYCTGVIRKQKVMDRNSAEPETSSRQDDSQPQDNEVAMLGIELSMLRIRALHCDNKVDDAMRHMQKLELAAPCSAKVIQLKRLLLDMKELKHQANELFKKGDYEQAQQVYSQALQLDSTNDEYCAVIYCNRAAALMGLQQYENALHDCNAALRRKTRYPRCLLRRARCNVALKRFAAAVADFDHYLKEYPSDSSSYQEVSVERQQAAQALENEVEGKRRKEEQQRGRKSNGRSKPQQQRRNSNRHAWDDSKFYEDFWRSSSSSTGSNRQQSSGARGNNAGPTTHNKHRRTHYEVLSISKTATQDQIKKAYRKLALLHHPDKAKDTALADLFKDMTAAYNVLSDPTARAKYDREIQYSGYGRYYEY